MTIHGHSYWYGKMVRTAGNVIKRWERLYETDIVRMFVEDALKATRSPGKRFAYKYWLDNHPKG